MQFEKLFRLLLRNDVKELALQADRPPCALVNDSYSPVMPRNLSEDEVIAALVEAGGQAQVLGLVESPRRWEFDHPALGKIRVSAGYHDGLLQARFRSLSKPAMPPEPPPAAAPARAAGLGNVPAGLAPTAPRARAATPVPFEAELPIPETSQAANLHELLASHEPVEVRRQAPRVASDGSPEQIFDSLLSLARSHNASDIHVLADRPPTLRIGGELLPVADPLDARLVERMLLATVPERVRQDLEQHGACDFAFSHPKFGRFRANVTRQRTGMKLTARPIHERIPTLEELGLPVAIGGATHHHQGLIVITGPTGHGKTTTLAAIVDIINRERSDHIITVEDPIEYVHPRKRAMISQREVGTHTKTFGAALKGSLREDPDVIVVGELRDTETVRMALSAAETGHLVISTMNTPNAAKTIERLIDLFPPGDQPQVRMTLAGGLRLIVSQRLVPSSDRSTVHAAAELLPGSPPLWALIRDNKTFQIPSLQQRGKSLGIVRMDDSLAELVRTGKTSLEIAREYADSPDQLETVVNGRPARPLDAAASAGQPAAFNAAEASREAAQAAQKLGKDVLSKAGRFFGSDKK
jgi:twitching motility protein PilT